MIRPVYYVSAVELAASLLQAVASVLPMLQKLDIRRSVIGDEGVALLADGLRRGRLPSLRDLRLVFAKIGHRFSPSRLSLPPAAALVIVRIALRRALDRCY